MTLANIDFKRVIDPLSAYYEVSRIQTAVGSLINFYDEEEFESGDIIEDWTPNDFENCQGIDIFVDALNYSDQRVNSQTNKQILFDWFCFWLWPNQPRPSDNPWSDRLVSGGDSLQPNEIRSPNRMQSSINSTVRYQFKKEITQKVGPNEAEQVANCFVRICNDEQADSDALKDDFDEEDGIDNSLIFEKFMEMDEMHKYRQMKSRFFDLLCMIIHEKDYVSFNLDSFETNPSNQNKERAKKMCLEKIPSLFQDDLRRRHSQKADNPLMKAKALDFENNFPFLSSIMDTFYRYVLDKNERYWKQNRPKSSESTIDTKCYRIFPSAWFRESGYYKQKRFKMSAKQVECIGFAIEGLQRRTLKSINLNHKRGATIYDSLDAFVKYYCAMNEFVFNKFTKLNYGPNNGTGDHLPVQIDLCIIPRLAKTNVYNNYVDDNDEHIGIIQSFGKNNQQMGEIWDLETSLNKSAYIKGRDYWTYQNIGPISRGLRYLWNNVSPRAVRYKRFIFMIDRRNPQHVKNKQMMDDTNNEQKWTDKMYLIIPKEANEIAKEYDNVLNEVFIENTKKYLFPVPNMKVHDIRQDLGGMEAANGYKFMVSYHLYNKNKAKMYWHYGQGMTRFFMNDIEWLWPRYFKADNKGCFQRFSVESKNTLNDAINKYVLRDSQFDDFRRQFEAFDAYK